jgi:Homeodomain-like domain
MSMARVVITAVVLEGRPKSAVARDYGVSRRWVQVLVARYLAGGEAAFEPRSRRPHTSPRRTSRATEDAIVALRKELTEAGYDAGAETIAWHLRQQAGSAPSVATIWHRPPRPDTTALLDPRPRRHLAHPSSQRRRRNRPPILTCLPHRPAHLGRHRPPAVNPHRNIPRSSRLLQLPREPKHVNGTAVLAWLLVLLAWRRGSSLIAT